MFRKDLWIRKHDLLPAGGNVTMTGKEWWELITKLLTVVLAGVALFVALYGYNVFKAEVDRMKDEAKELRTDLKSLRDEVTQARIKTLEELNKTATDAERRIIRLQLQTEEDASKVAKNVKQASDVLGTANDLVKTALKADEPARKFLLEALENKKLLELAHLQDRIEKLAVVKMTNDTGSLRFADDLLICWGAVKFVVPEKESDRRLRHGAVTFLESFASAPNVSVSVQAIARDAAVGWSVANTTVDATKCHWEIAPHFVNMGSIETTQAFPASITGGSYIAIGRPKAH
jgi:hypothetical protein